VPERLNEKKLGAIIVLLIASIAPSMILGGYVANAIEPAHHGHPPGLAITDRCLTKNTANLNFTCTISNYASEANPINQLIIVMGNNQFNSLTVYVNGTIIDSVNTPLFTIQPRDNARVCVLVPYINNPYALSALQNNGNMSAIHVTTPEVLYYSECNLNS